MIASTRNTLIRIALLAVIAGAGVAQAKPFAYVRSSVGEPWSRSDNIDTLNDLFGAGSVDTLLYQTLSLSDLFSADREMILMTGGDDSSPALGSFLTSNQAAVEGWVAGGGSLVIMAAENGGGLGNLGFGANWVGTSNSDGLVADASHPVYAGTGLANGQLIDGNHFHHDSVTGSGFTTLATSTFDDSTILMEREWGDGHVIIGTLTLNYFRASAWDQPASGLIQENLFLYAAGVPEPAALALVVCGVAVIATIRRR